MDEFFKQMDQTAMFYQRAVMFLAAERVAEMQDALDAQVVQIHRPKPPFRQKVGRLFHNFLQRCTPRLLDKRKREEKPRDTRPTVIAVSPLPWPLDQAPWIEGDIEFFPQITNPIDGKKGDQSHE